MKQPFCTAPWHSISLSPSGEIGPCCIIPFGLGNVSRGTSLESAWNGPELKKFRKDILDGNLPSGCQQCANKDKNGVKSTRTLFTETFTPWRDSVEEYTEEGFNDEFYHLDLSLSNKCNLKCRFCYSGNSTSWFKDRDIMKDADKNWVEILGDTETVVDVAPDEILPFVTKLKNLKQIELKGGEPFMSRGHLPLLQLLIDSGRAQDLTLHYTTNGTMIDMSAFELLKKFYHVSLAVSVDGVGPHYQYIRGGKYSFEEDVLPTLYKINSKYLPNLKMNLHYTICAYNLLHLSEFLKWYVKSGLRTSLSFGMVEKPSLLNIRLLPKEIILEAIKKLEAFDLPEVKKLLVGLNSSLQNTNTENRLSFYNYTRKIDEIRSTSLKDKVPELANFYESLANQFPSSSPPPK